MDVWFDSGSSWAGVARAREDLDYPADLYLEGENEAQERKQRALVCSELQSVVVEALVVVVMMAESGDLLCWI